MWVTAMYKMSHTKKYVITAMCITLCSVLPLVLHAVPGAGNTLLPMHIPVLLCGLIVGWPFGLLAGLFGPMLSTFTTGMPVVAYMPVMMVELATYGLVAGLVAQFIRTKNVYRVVYIALIPAMLLGRVTGALAALILISPVAAESTAMAWFISSYFVTSLPGIVIQLVLIPAIIVALEKGHLVHRR